MKIIAFYLPQFHEIPENNEWWGEGFTEWTNVRKAKPLFEGHYQPRVPLNNNYYDLTDINVMRWQSEIAEKYGVYGFCFYHYWFNGKLLLHKPVEMYRDDPECKTHYCICWANEDWTNNWSSDNPTFLVKQTYGDKKEWEEHFNYFLPFFKDPRYIKEDNKPFLVLYEPSIVKGLEEMVEYWNELAKQNGFDGIVMAAQSTRGRLDGKPVPDVIDYQIDYEPQYAYSLLKQQSFPILRKCKRIVRNFLKKNFNSNAFEKVGRTQKLQIFDYDEVWKKILSLKPQSPKDIPGAFVDWDNTVRKGDRGFVINGATPEKFDKYLKEQINRAETVYNKDMIFLFAWNEWAECGYMEPDEKYGYGYLEAVKETMGS
ncbi:MAG: glycoside hydrolase family 99-like domain-containing protein [Lachnospiraceae bacterium]|nr:glycoside hydrolase family 99-like domain-containing protein [Lachnospiraceae bacterium]